MDRNVTKSKNNRKQMVLAVVIPVFVVALTVAVCLQFYNRYIDRVLYAERLSQMQDVTSQLFTGLEDVVENQWETAQSQCNHLAEQNPATTDELVMYMQKHHRLDLLGSEYADIIAVDNLGRYYTQNGPRGMLDAMDLLTDNPERITYLYNSMTEDKTLMVFLIRLDEPLELMRDERPVSITYYGISKNMHELEQYFDCAAYSAHNDVYVLDTAGSKLFQSSNADLLSGHNAYAVLQHMRHLHGGSFEESHRELDENGVSYSNAVEGKTEYYYSLYRMENAAWVIFFLVPSDFVATNTVTMINTTVLLIMIFAAVLVIMCSLSIFLILRTKQRQALLIERENNEALESINRKLDQNNAALSKAVHEAEKATREAREANKAKSSFLANMSHDIRTPMNAIVGITELMNHETGLSEKMHSYIVKIQNSSRYLLSLINDILDMSKIESGEVRLVSEPFGLADVLWQADSLIRAQTSAKMQDFTVRIHDIVHEFLIGDNVRLRQIFMNLLTNAVKYTPPRGKIELDLYELPCEAPDRAKFKIVVTDNGCGMSSDFIGHIFEPFTRAESSATCKIRGTGLGMSITKSIVDMMHGEIHVESKPDEGSRFYVELTFPIDRNIKKELCVKRLLLIGGDELLYRNILADLAETDASLTAAAEENEALALIEKSCPDVILLANRLFSPDLSSIIEKLRKQTDRCAGRHIPIFCVDYASYEQNFAIALKSGADALMVRPFFASELNGTIKKQCVLSPDEEARPISVLSGKRFLCAEDNALNAEILSALLQTVGASCVIYADGEEIVRAFRDVRPGEFDAILMDVQMPKMNGYEASRAIRASENPLGKTIPIVAMTANAFSEDVTESLASGMDAHISKPLDMAKLEQIFSESYHSLRRQ